MELTFIHFWRSYAPRKEFANRYRACERLWQAMDEKRRVQILRELENEQTERSPPHTKQSGDESFRNADQSRGRRIRTGGSPLHVTL